MSKTTSRLTLNFFGEIVTLPIPQSLDALRKDISRLYFFSPEDAKEIILTYNENDDIIMIESDEDFNVFLKSNIDKIDLDISQTSKIFKKNLDIVREENEKDKKDLEILIKKNEELDKMKETEFVKEKEELKKIREEIMKLHKKKHALRKKIIEGTKKINLEKKENDKKIIELKKKLGIPITINTHPKVIKHKPNKRIHCQHLKCFPPKVLFKNKYPFPLRKRNEEDIKNKTIEDWKNCLLNKTQEFTNKLANTLKEIPLFNLTLNGEEDKKENKSLEKNEKEIHYCVRCDGCGMHPLIGKRFKCKQCPNFDFCEACLEKNKDTHKHEFTQITKNKIFKAKTIKEEKKEELKLADKIVHFGVKCDGCGTFPIIGCRYKCVICNNFDFCEECENKKGEEHNHPFMKIYEPKMAPLALKFKGKKKN